MTISPELGALILAGGEGRRMGCLPKALLTADGVSFLSRLTDALSGFHERILSTNHPGLTADSGLLSIPDRQKGLGPLGGIASALSVCESDGLLVVACDMPMVTAEFAAFLASFANRGWPAWACRDRQGRLHPLCGVYRKCCLPAITEYLTNGGRRVGPLFERVGGQAVCLADTPFPDSVLLNINTPEQLALLPELL